MAAERASQNALRSPSEIESLQPPRHPRCRARLPEDIGPFKQLVQEYTRVPADQIDAHIHRIRDMAYAIAPYSAFGAWDFTRISAVEDDPRYQLAVSRLCAPDSNEFWIDVGCGLGQNLRQLLHAGVPALKIGAVEIRKDLFEVGFELFKDRHLNPHPDFIPGDLIKDPMARFRRKATILHAANLFHLFDWPDQLFIAHTLSNFLQAQLEGEDEKRVFIFGRQIGSFTPGGRQAGQGTEERYLHNQESFQRLWDTMQWVTGWQWKVEVQMLGRLPPEYEYLGGSARYQRFVVWRIPR